MMVSPGSRSAPSCVDRLLGDVPRRQHDPDGPRLLEQADELLEIGGGGDALAGQRLDGRRVAVEHHAFVAIARQAANDVAAHAPQANHAKLHLIFSRYLLTRALAGRRP